MSNLALRLLSAGILLPIVITCFVLGGWYMTGLAIVAAAASYFEFGAVVAKHDPVLRVALFVMGVAVTVIGIFVSGPVTALLTLQLAFVVLSVLTVLRAGNDLPLVFKTLAGLVFSILWVAPGLISLVRLRDLGDVHTGTATACYLMVCMVATWANDTCAYFAGRFLGKHKMAGTISPKKTWEGFVGGAFGVVAFLVGGHLWFDMFAPLTWIDIAIVSLPIAVLGPIGDLVESLWKRAYEIKDSGNLIPGHGGMLDRMDAIYFVGPWVLVYFVGLKPWLATTFGW
ncbi:MAG TPA: phosphatidate cytidylyltransferase [Myxococcota bacterium]